MQLPHELRCIDRDRLEDIDPDGLFVIICRYIRPTQLQWIRHCRTSLAGVAYFVDDDICALIADRHVASGYRFYLTAFACLPMLALNGILTDLWASTPALASALSKVGQDVHVLHPAPVADDYMSSESSRSGNGVRIVYHATDAHSREHAFLIPVMQEVLRRRPQSGLEVLARGRNLRYWRSAAIPSQQLAILSPMGWTEYHRYSRTHGADIALMPLLEGLANNSRADTKLIDCSRLGAAAVMSDVSPYRRNPASSIPRIRNTPSEWIEALVELIDRPDLREAAKHATCERVMAMKPDGHEPFPKLLCGGER